MSGLPSELHSALTTALGSEPRNVRTLSGGMVSRAARVETDDGPVFVKWNETDTSAMFHAEIKGLAAIRDTATLRVPQVLAIGDEPPFLALEYIEPTPPVDAERFTRRFAELLAQMHHTPSTAGFGFGEDNFIGALPQRNEWRDNWPQFYRECRLLPQIEMARQRGRLTPRREAALYQVVDNVVKLLSDLPSRPVLLHGDLWSGNFLTAGDEPVVIDPSVYYGEREVEMTFVEMFGGFPKGFVEAYHAIYPLDTGYERRRPLHELYPLLVHLNHFGESYGPQVERACALSLQTLR